MNDKNDALPGLGGPRRAELNSLSVNPRSISEAHGQSCISASLWGNETHTLLISIREKFKKIVEYYIGILLSIVLTIDRITISFRDYKGSFNGILGSLRRYKNFKENKPSKIPWKSITYHFEYKDSEVLITKYFYKNKHRDEAYYNWHTLTCTNPSPELQSILKAILEDNIRHEEDMSLSQVEFTSDLIPAHEAFLKPLEQFLKNHLVLKYSRAGFFFILLNTEYQGKNHNVREGSKGLRVYPKTENGVSFVRVELQVNRPFLRSRGLNVSSLPLVPDAIDIFEYLELRHGLNPTSFDKLCRALSNKHFKNTRGVPYSDKLSKARFYGLFRALMLSGIGRNYFGLDDAPVGLQVSLFKKFKGIPGIKHAVDCFFPKMTLDQLPQLGKGSSSSLILSRKTRTSSDHQVVPCDYWDDIPDDRIFEVADDNLLEEDEGQYYDDIPDDRIEDEPEDDDIYEDIIILREEDLPCEVWGNSPSTVPERVDYSETDSHALVEVVSVDQPSVLRGDQIGNTSCMGPEGVTPECSPPVENSPGPEQTKSSGLTNKMRAKRHHDISGHAAPLPHGKLDTGTNYLGHVDSPIKVVNVDPFSIHRDKRNPILTGQMPGTQFHQDMLGALPSRQWRDVGMKLLNVWRDDLRRSSDPWPILNAFGIEDHMIDVCGLGWNRSLPPCSSRNWGLPPEKYGVIRLPEGLVIAHLDGIEPIHISIISRDLVRGCFNRYVIPGSGKGSCLVFKGVECSRTFIVTNELDAIHAKQQAGDLVNVVALGDSDVIPNSDIEKLLNRSNRLLMAVSDPLPIWWTERYEEKVKILPFNPGKPLCRSFKDKGNLRNWLLSDLMGSDPRKYIRNDILPDFS